MSSLYIRDHNWRSGGYGKMSIREALAEKSNVALYRMLLKCKEERLNRNAELYSFSLYGALHECMEKETVKMWQALTSDERTTNAQQLAVAFGALYDHSAWVDIKNNLAITQETKPVNDLGETYMHNIMTGLNQGDGIQAFYAPEGVSMAGIYGNYSGKELKNGKSDWGETSFVGAVPAEHPRYYVSVCINRPNGAHSPKELAQSIVNDLVAWLNAH